MNVALVFALFNFNNFDLIYLTTQGGPLDRTMTLPAKNYEVAFKGLQVGMSSTLAVMMLILLAIVSTVYLNSSGSPPTAVASLTMKGKLLARIGFSVSFVLVTAAVVAPFCWLLFCSIKPRADLFLMGAKPRTLTLSNYFDLFNRTEIGRFLWNSTWVAATVTGLTVVVSTLGAYSLIFFRYRGREFIGRAHFADVYVSRGCNYRSLS